MRFRLFFVFSLVFILLHLSGCSYSCYVDNIETIPNDTYTVLEVRETVGGNNIRTKYLVNVVLENINNDRFYYSYYALDLKDTDYLNVAKLVKGDSLELKENVLCLR